MDPPPPRYRLESDSSDEEGHGIYPSSGAGVKPSKQHTVVVTPSRELNAKAGVVGIGQAGKYLVRRVRGERVLDVTVNGKPVGAGFAVGACVVVILEEVEVSVAFELAKRITEVVGVSDWTIFSSYVPAMYIPAPGERVTDTPEVRSLSSTGQGSYGPPNYVTGLAGAFLSLAAHPATQSETSLQLLPLPLSSLPARTFASAVSSLPAELSQQLAQPSLWTEDDDERFAGPGMGLKPHQQSQPTDSMYM